MLLLSCTRASICAARSPRYPVPSSNSSEPIPARNTVGVLVPPPFLKEAADRIAAFYGAELETVRLLYGA